MSARGLGVDRTRVPRALGGGDRRLGTPRVRVSEEARAKGEAGVRQRPTELRPRPQPHTHPQPHARTTPRARLRASRPPLRRPSVPAALLSLLVLLTGCGVYSFSGASIPSRLETVAVPLAEVRAAGGPATLDQLLTDALVDRFADRSRLSLEPDEAQADAVVRAVVERYSISPAGVTSDDVAELNRIALSVRVVVEDRVGEALDGGAAVPGELLARTFTASADFDPATGFAGEADAVAEAVDQIARDAFTAATSDW